MRRHIKDAKRAGYEESEIVGAAMHLIVPGLTLRKVLETETNLTQRQLTLHLGAQFGEQNVTYLCNNLLGEIPYAFLMT